MDEVPERNEATVVSGAVRVEAPARLHFGFLDLHGGLGRRFGSIGLAIDEPSLVLTARHSASLAVAGEEADRVRGYARAAAGHLGSGDAVSIRVERAIPAHAGFGSGTQLALAVAAAMARLSGAAFSAEAFSSSLDRGNRSGVGLCAFTEGGLIVDGGRGADGGPPPVIARLRYPEHWRIVLILDSSMAGVHGTREVEAFRDLPRFPAAQAAEICRIVLMQVLPAAALAEPQGFGAGITRIQDLIGDHFAPHQGGRYASAAVAQALAQAAAQGVPGYGQSSWGPTGFVLMPSETEARALVANLDRGGPLRFIVARGRNAGAAITGGG
ncbi:beta-ribofuranosylaminobenzene 5'-phosphate synthase family protein [Methylobacterium sp. NEAU K]|uniref:beta-ribofuranosylaminobenzene 5'-phosphate synthase family protein n=1 Tax=Methylobacterium sp. NEAU K TaxID=3064946 RepID=UPI002735636C|nr:beta-ribofuranosylaminobenzene 5'-phosphate synthase family protein [Methylobacterium sp. NEAU K]MDP4002516.1 GHMP kinase [Methylobacterium sp. NEAU K]